MADTRDPLIVTRLVSYIRPVLAVVMAGVVAFTLCVLSGSTSSAISTAGTPLPAGWELCVLQGIGAPVTQANVSDLDEWQAAEGGSTNNTAAYNPFNTARATDAAGAPLPGVTSANGFPAFSDWMAGCAATVATLLQPNMSSITAALRTGNVSPPPAFLAAVDQSQWCAPSADGTPCYADAIMGAAGNVATGVLNQSAALEVYGNVKSDVHDYQQAVTTVLADQAVLTGRQQQYAAAITAVSDARQHLASAQHELQRIAVDEYVSNGLYVSGSYFNPKSGATPFGPQNADGVIAQQYQMIVANDLVARFEAAQNAVKAAQASRDDAARGVAQAMLTLASDDTGEKRSLVRLVADVATMQKAGACTTAVIVTPAAGATAVQGTSNQSPGAANPASPNSSTTTTTTTTTPTTTTTTSTTTTTTPAGASTTTIPAGNPSIALPTTTTSSTVPPSSAPTTAPPTPSAPATPTSSTTTTTTTPASSGTGAGSQPSVNPAGISALQGCVATLAPPAGA
jgi:hypothetical protein